MNVTIITTIDYDNIIDSNSIKDCKNIIKKIIDISTDNENNMGIFIPTLLLTIPCRLSFFCLISLMIYTIIKPLITNK